MDDRVQDWKCVLFMESEVKKNCWEGLAVEGELQNPGDKESSNLKIKLLLFGSYNFR